MSKGHQGFSKPRANRMEVNTDEVAAMQRGYETRIARQKAALDRVMSMLQQRTEDVAEHMRRADAMARYRDEAESLAEETDGEEFRILDRPDMLKDIAYLFQLIPKDYDLYNEDDTKTTIIHGYIVFLQDTVHGLKRKVEEITRDLRQARTDASNNAKVANVNAKAAAVNISDQDPPWIDPNDKQSFSAQADHTASSVWNTDDNPDGDHEVLEWPGAAPTMNPGEQRPGSF